MSLQGMETLVATNNIPRTTPQPYNPITVKPYNPITVKPYNPHK